MNPRAITPKDWICFFGYYDKCQWDEDEKRIIYHRVLFQDRAPTADDEAQICLTECATGKTEVVARTRAWNFQQGAMLQWIPGNRILFNDRVEGRFVTRILDLSSGRERTVGRPVSAVSPDGKRAVSLNFARLAVWRPGYGYEGIPDPFWLQLWPEEDGIWALDLETGAETLAVPLADMLAYRKEPGVEGFSCRFNHTLFTPDGSRFIFLCRWKRSPFEGHFTRLFTASPDGKDVRDLCETYGVSHFDWKNSREILAFAELDGAWGFYVIADLTGEHRLVSPHMQKTDGHCSYNDAETLILNDTYPVDERRGLSLFDTRTERTIELGSFFSPKTIGEIRCDLHPRWSRSERMISFDSFHEGYRRCYALDVAA